eukprot:m.293175 g.293175  ORF g.293175 m.293175 type:complete len:125 (+) comp18884_c0_seq1:225-599(+)
MDANKFSRFQMSHRSVARLVTLTLLCMSMSSANAAKCELKGQYCTALSGSLKNDCRKFQDSPFTTVGKYPLELHLNVEFNNGRTCTTGITQLCVEGLDCCTSWHGRNFLNMNKDLEACVTRHLS